MLYLYIFAILSLPLALVLPYHFAFISLALGGVIHIFSEMTYFTKEKKILRKRQSFPPIVILGAVFLTAVGIGWYLRGLGGTDIETEYYYRGFYLVVGFYTILSIYPVMRKSSDNLSKFILGFSILLSAVLGSVYPILFAFVLVHGHNLVPWVFLAQEKGKFQYFHSLVISLILPIFGIFIFIIGDYEISSLTLSDGLETDLFRHVVPLLSPFSPELLLLSFFGYSQAIHYALWIFLIPTSGWRERFTGFLSEVSFFLGYSKVKMLTSAFAILLLFVLSSLLFLCYPVEWRRWYFVLSAGHVYMELPLLFLIRR
ncbi:MAG: hypothetical protein JJT78_14045 [Leptospira sp.]|nr:hypothetical protein [Leptospira sp.]